MWVRPPGSNWWTMSTCCMHIQLMSNQLRCALPSWIYIVYILVGYQVS